MLRKFLALSTALCIFCIVLSGCSDAELALIEATKKTNQIPYSESSAEITFSVGVDNLAAEQLESIDETIQIINSTKITLDSKVLQNEDQTKAQGVINLGVDIGQLGMAFSTDIWVDVDFSEQQPVVKEIIKIPPILAQRFDFDREYLVMDFDSDTLEQEMSQFDFTKMFSITKDLNTLFEDYFTTVDFEMDMPVVTNTGNVYTVKLDDQLTKHIIKTALIDILQNDGIINAFKDMILSASPEDSTAIESFESVVGGGQAVQAVSEVFDAISDIQIIADDGITVNHVIDDNGIISSTDGSINIILDTAALSNAFSDSAVGVAGSDLPVINLGINFKTAINKTADDGVIEFPELTADNSIDYFEYLTSLLGYYTYDTLPIPAEYDFQAVDVVLNGSYVDFSDVPAMITDSRTMVPLRGLFEHLEAEVSYNDGIINVTKDGIEITLEIDNDLAYVNGQEVYLDVPAMLINERTLVPVRFIAEALGADVGFENNTVFIITK